MAARIARKCTGKPESPHVSALAGIGKPIDCFCFPDRNHKLHRRPGEQHQANHAEQPCEQAREAVCGAAAGEDEAAGHDGHDERRAEFVARIRPSDFSHGASLQGASDGSMVKSFCGNGGVLPNYYNRPPQPSRINATTSGLAKSQEMKSRRYMRSSVRNAATASGPMSSPTIPNAPMPPMRAKNTTAPPISRSPLMRKGLTTLSMSPTTTAAQIARKSPM